MTIISTERAPAAIGPYSQAVLSGALVFTSGMIPVDPATGNVVEGGIAAQAAQVMRNLEALLDAAGTTPAKAVKTTCYLADMGDFAVFNEIYAATFQGNPARSCVAVKALPKGVLCEVEVIAEV